MGKKKTRMPKRGKRGEKDKGILASVRGMVRDLVGDAVGDVDLMRRAKRLAKNSGGAARSFLSNQTRQQYSPLTRNLGAKILRMGPNVPAEVRAMAQDAVDGTSDMKEKDLLNALRDSLGIERSGAKQLNRYVGKIRGYTSQAARIGTLYDVSQRGGVQGVAAGSQLAQEGVEIAERIVSSKPAQKFAAAVADKIVKNPLIGSRLLTGLGRILRLAGPIGVAVHATLQGAQSLIADRQEGNSALLKGISAGKRYGIDASLDAEIRRSVKPEAATGVMGTVRNVLGLTGAINTERNERAEAEYQLTAQARGLSVELGLDPAALLRKRAAELGIPVSMLSQAEVDRVLNEASRSKAFSKVKKELIEDELIKNGVLHDRTSPAGAVVAQVGDMTGRNMRYGKRGVYAPGTTEATVAAEEESVRNQFVVKILKDLAVVKERLESEHQKFLSTPQGVQYTKRMDQVVRDSRLQQQAYLRRKPVSWVD